MKVKEKLKITVFRDVAPCGLLEVYRRIRGSYCLYHQVELSDDRVSKNFLGKPASPLLVSGLVKVENTAINYTAGV